MKEYIRKIGLLGIGIVALTREKAEELANDLVKKGELTQDEGKALVKDLLKKSEEQGKELTKRIDREVKKTLKGINVASREDVRRLEKRIDKLEKALKKEK